MTGNRVAEEKVDSKTSSPIDSIWLNLWLDVWKPQRQPSQMAMLRRSPILDRPWTVSGDKHPSVGKVDMGEIFLGTTWGMLLKIIFSVSPCVLLVNFTLGELFCFFRCLGRVFWMFVSAWSWFSFRKSGSNDACPTATSCLDLGVLVGAFVALIEAPWKPKTMGLRLRPLIFAAETPQEARGMEVISAISTPFSFK